jgi:hypothetical protein
MQLKKYNNIISEQKWRLRNLNPGSPYMKAYIKLHKQNNPIRPIVSRYNAPAYNLAKYLNIIIQRLGNMPNSLNVTNSI